MEFNLNGSPSSPESIRTTRMVDNIGRGANEALLDLQIQTFC